MWVIICLDCYGLIVIELLFRLCYHELVVKRRKGEMCMRKKLKPDQDLESIQSDLIGTVCFNYQKGVSVRALAKKFELSPMKTRKILITGGVYSTDLSTEISEMYQDGKTVGEIAELLSTTPANVNSYLPYERIIYNMEEKSVEADRQQRYRDRKRAGIEQTEKELPKIERARDRTMIFVIGKKLRKLIPDEVLDESSDPLARDRSTTWGSNVTGTFEFHEPADPDRSIWCAEVTMAGRGKNKKTGVVLMSANCGFVVMALLPSAPVLSTITNEEPGSMDWMEREERERENKEKLKTYRITLETVFIDAIRQEMIDFCLPEDRVLDYTDTVARVELVKGRSSTPGVRLEELIEQELQWRAGDDPVKQFNVRGNWTNRKFGNSGSYRYVDAAARQMLRLSTEESAAWLTDFLKPVREKMTGKV